MHDKDLLRKLELKLMSYSTRQKDLEAENAKLRARIAELEKQQKNIS